MRTIALLAALLLPPGRAVADRRLDAILSVPPPARAEPPGAEFFDAHGRRVRHAMLIPGATGRDPQDEARATDRLHWLHEERSGDSATLRGFGLFSGATVAAAHAPQPLRWLFDRQLHAGPALLNGGGLGFGVGGDL
jgi:hypothetical protein